MEYKQAMLIMMRVGRESFPHSYLAQCIYCVHVWCLVRVFLLLDRSGGLLSYVMMPRSVQSDETGGRGNG